MTEEECERARTGLLPDGEYDGVISVAVSKYSASGNPMIELGINVYNGADAHYIKDYLVSTEKMMWKIIKCAKSADIFKEYNEGKFNETILMGRNVKVKVKIQAGSEIQEDRLNGKEKGTKYPDKNVIADYLLGAKKDVVPSYKSDYFKPEDEDVPF